MKTVILGTTLTFPFEVILYKCEDKNCELCDFDLTFLSTGSKLCPQCKQDYSWYPAQVNCINCGNGVLEVNETCDDGNFGGCTYDCLNVT